MHRETADILHAAAGTDIELAVPGETRPLRVMRMALAQGIELQIETRPQHRLRIRQDRARRIDAARQSQAAKRDERRAKEEGFHSAASFPCPKRLLSDLSNFSAASAITVPGGKIASAPAILSVS
jgi:hypothetical protein